MSEIMGNSPYGAAMDQLAAERAAHEATKAELAKQTDAANHWFAEAQKAHNDAVRATPAGDAVRLSRSDAEWLANSVHHYMGPEQVSRHTNILEAALAASGAGKQEAGDGTR